MNEGNDELLEGKVINCLKKQFAIKVSPKLLVGGGGGGGIVKSFLEVLGEIPFCIFGEREKKRISFQTEFLKSK